MYCSKCGKEVKDSAAFCPNCGAKVNIGAVSENTDKTRLDVTAKSDIKKKKKVRAE